MEKFHKSVTPCPMWGHDHKCYQCACAQAAQAHQVNDIALTLEEVGVPCSIEQTGGFTMVVHVPTNNGKKICLTSEGMWVEEEEDVTPVECEVLGEDKTHPMSKKEMYFLAECVQHMLGEIK